MQDGSQRGDENDLQRVLLELGRVVLSEESLESVLLAVSGTAKVLLPRAAEVSVSVLRGDHFETAASTGPLATEVDERQYELRNGPCMEAALTGQVLLIEDMATEERWRAFTERAQRAGARSSLSVPLPVADQIAGALNIYGTEPAAFDEDDIEVAQLFSAHAAVAVHNAQLYARTAQLAERLESAMADRATIEQAKGIIMARDRVKPDAAFDALRQASQRLNVKVREIAARIVDTGQHPDELT